MTNIDITASNVIAAAGSRIQTGIAGTTIAAGDVVYLLGSTYVLADADLEPSAEVAGIALNGASTTQPFDFITSGTLTIGVTNPVTLPALVYYLSDTAGKYENTVPATGDFVSTVGIGLTSTTLSVQIHNSAIAKPA